MFKKIFVLSIVVVVSASALFAGGGKDGDKDKVTGVTTSDTKRTSYALGLYLGKEVLAQPVSEILQGLDYASFLEAFKAAIEGKQLSMTEDEAVEEISLAISAKRAIASKSFLDGNGKRKGVLTTASGLQYEVIREGTGDSPHDNDTVGVFYTGTLSDGTVFESTEGEIEPVPIPLGGDIIKGWLEGLKLMKTGGITKLFIPPELTYNDGTVLIFEVELVSIIPGLPGDFSGRDAD
jgi:FKBP-type peptidyl-prolyl cis-trans isomerase